MGPRGTKVLNQNGVENSLTKTGWWFQPLWKILANGKDDIPYSMENKSHVPNHQTTNQKSFWMGLSIRSSPLLLFFFYCGCHSKRQTCCKTTLDPYCKVEQLDTWTSWTAFSFWSPSTCM
jgi:hypothetical protein